MAPVAPMTDARRMADEVFAVATEMQREARERADLDRRLLHGWAGRLLATLTTPKPTP